MARTSHEYLRLQQWASRAVGRTEIMIRALIERRSAAAEREVGGSSDAMRYMVRASLRAFQPFTTIFAISSCRRRLPADAEAQERVVELFREEGLAELSLAIGASRFFPTVKRALGYGASWALVPVTVPREVARHAAATPHALRGG